MDIYHCNCFSGKLTYFHINSLSQICNLTFCIVYFFQLPTSNNLKNSLPKLAPLPKSPNGLLGKLPETVLKADLSSTPYGSDQSSTTVTNKSAGSSLIPSSSSIKLSNPKDITLNSENPITSSCSKSQSSFSQPTDTYKSSKELILANSKQSTDQETCSDKRLPPSNILSEPPPLDEDWEEDSSESSSVLEAVNKRQVIKTLISQVTQDKWVGVGTLCSRYYEFKNCS